LGQLLRWEGDGNVAKDAANTLKNLMRSDECRRLVISRPEIAKGLSLLVTLPARPPAAAAAAGALCNLMSTEEGRLAVADNLEDCPRVVRGLRVLLGGADDTLAVQMAAAATRNFVSCEVGRQRMLSSPDCDGLIASLTTHLGASDSLLLRSTAGSLKEILSVASGRTTVLQHPMAPQLASGLIALLCHDDPDASRSAAAAVCFLGRSVDGARLLTRCDGEVLAGLAARLQDGGSARHAGEALCQVLRAAEAAAAASSSAITSLSCSLDGLSVGVGGRTLEELLQYGECGQPLPLVWQLVAALAPLVSSQQPPDASRHATVALSMLMTTQGGIGAVMSQGQLSEIVSGLAGVLSAHSAAQVPAGGAQDSPPQGKPMSDVLRAAALSLCRIVEVPHGLHAVLRHPTCHSVVDGLASLLGSPGSPPDLSRRVASALVTLARSEEGRQRVRDAHPSPPR